MKKLSFITICLLWAISVFAQKPALTKKTWVDYEKMLQRFADHYNHMQLDSLRSICQFADSWTEAHVGKMHKEYGNIVSFVYIGPFNDQRDTKGNLMHYFKVTFSRRCHLDEETTKFFGEENCFEGKLYHACAISLTEENKIWGIAFPTCARGTDSLLARYR